MAQPLSSIKSLRLVRSTIRTTATASEPRPSESLNAAAAQYTPRAYGTVKFIENLLLSDSAPSSNNWNWVYRIKFLKGLRNTGWQDDLIAKERHIGNYSSPFNASLFSKSTGFQTTKPGRSLFFLASGEEGRYSWRVCFWVKGTLTISFSIFGSSCRYDRLSLCR